MTHVAYDAAYPEPNGVPGTDTVLIYSGGDTPHAWTAAEIAAQPERWRLPVWVRSYGGVNPNADSAAMIQWLKSNNVPTNTATVLDLETLVDPTYVNQYAAALHAAGYLVLPYGSASTLFSNPELDGYFVAEPGATEIDARCVATQFGYYAAYDLSWIEDSVPLWDTQPPAPPVPPPPPVHYAGDKVTRIEVPVFKTDAAGWTAIAVQLPTGKTNHDIIAVTCDAASAYDPQGWHMCEGAPDFNATGRIVFKSILPHDSFTARVWVAD